MKGPALSRQRCAIYTRKSTEHNLDLAFNSLDAQREACEAYIKSQAHEGWTLVPAHFDDGGLSGASLDRPALQTLLDAVRARKVDIIVVYKVDRLTRSLADFAKLVELFDESDVSFVSVTQAFNTTSSMGRLTLNVLLSFAQFEREVIGERVRDKIAASKRKGLWVGGPVPLGYRSVAKTLEIVSADAELVRKIFADYLRLGSIAALAASLEQDGIRPKPRLLSSGKIIAAARFMVGPLAHMLKNRFYIGEIDYRGEIHQGLHEAILDRATFEAVQTSLRHRTVIRSAARARSPSLLAGLLFDDRGNAMTPSHANKKGVRYRYYVSQALLQGRPDQAGHICRVAAVDIEQRIVAAIRSQGLAEGSADLGSDREVIETHLAKATIERDGIRLALCHPIGSPEDPDSDLHQRVIIVPFTKAPALRKGIAHEPSGRGTIDDDARRTLLTAIARSRGWIDTMVSGAIESFEAIAQREKLVERHVRFLAPLAYVSPRIVEAIANSRAPADLTVSRLARALPLSWAKQEEQLGFG